LTSAQLTREQRYQIYILRKAGHRQSFIAGKLSVHPSIISRKLKRGRGRRGYRPKQADELASARKQKRYRARICAFSKRTSADAQILPGRRA
jgi:IS30 family transposase